MGRPYEAAFTEQAVRLVREGSRSVAAVARAWGVPDNTLHGWVHAMDQHPAEPLVGSGRLRAAEQAARDLARRLCDWEEENAIGNKARRLVASGRQ